jgi:putative transposase
MRQEDDYRRDRYVVSALNVQLVFVTKYWRGVLTGEHLHALWSVFTSVCADFDAELVEMNGQNNHTCRRAAREPAEGRLCPPAAAALPGANPPVHLWSPSYFDASAGGAPWEMLKAYNASGALRTRRG